MVPLAVVLAVVTALTPVVVYVTYEMAFRGKIYPGVQIDRAKGQGLRAKGVKIIYGEKTWEVKADQLGVNLDWDRTREKLYRTGRSGNFIDDLEIKYRAYREGITIEPEFDYNRELVEELASTISR